MSLRKYVQLPNYKAFSEYLTKATYDPNTASLAQFIARCFYPTSRSFWSSKEEEECVICLQEYNDQHAQYRVGNHPKYKHTFGGECLLAWVLASNNCPHCRERLFCPTAQVDDRFNVYFVHSLEILPVIMARTIASGSLPEHEYTSMIERWVNRLWHFPQTLALQNGLSEKLVTLASGMVFKHRDGTGSTMFVERKLVSGMYAVMRE